MKKEKRSFFERITGIGSGERDAKVLKQPHGENWTEQNQEEAQLAVDVYQTPTEIIVISMIAGVKSEDLDISITREMVTIKAKREEPESLEREICLQRTYWDHLAELSSYQTKLMR